MTSEVSVPASAAMRDVTIIVRLTGLRVFRARVWLACRLLTLAAWVAGCGIRWEKS